MKKKEIRIIGTYSEPWFVARDICNILNIKDVSMAVSKLPDDWKGTKVIGTLGGEQNMSIINESALYRMIMRSNKLIAEKFQNCVCEEILPSIRKTGEYKLKEIIDAKNKELKLIEDQKKLIEDQKKLIEDELKVKNKENKNLHTMVKKKERRRYRYSHSVYIISNPDIKNCFKIGMTSDRNKRLSALAPGAPGAPQPYNIEYSRELCNAYEEKSS